MAYEAIIFYKVLSSLLSEKWKEPYALVLRCRLSLCLQYSASEEFGLLKATMYIKSAPIDLIQSETQFLCWCITVIFALLYFDVVSYCFYD